MIEAMRTLALDYLFEKVGDKNNLPEKLEEWYHNLRNDHPERLSPFLVEDVEGIEKVYILYPDEIDSSMVNMVPQKRRPSNCHLYSIELGQ